MKWIVKKVLLEKSFESLAANLPVNSITLISN
jgi:hypothetical protein